MLRVVVIDPDNSLIALIKSATNSIHICKLQLVSEQQPCLHTLCFLRLPIRYHTNYTNPASVFMEWIPTSKPQDRTEFQTSRGRPFPFRSHRSGTIVLILSFKTRDEGLQYAMFVSVEALISVVHSGASHVSWAEWGPAGTRILPLGNGIQPRPAGPFWITSYAPLVVLDYNPLRARYIKRQKKLTRTSSIPSKPSLGPRSTKLFGEHWAEGEVKTQLPFRKLVADGLYFKRVAQIVADREWIVVIARSVRCSTLLDSLEKPTMCADRERGKEFLSPYTMWARLRPFGMFCRRRGKRRFRVGVLPRYVSGLASYQVHKFFGLALISCAFYTFPYYAIATRNKSIMY